MRGTRGSSPRPRSSSFASAGLCRDPRERGLRDRRSAAADAEEDAERAERAGRGTRTRRRTAAATPTPEEGTEGESRDGRLAAADRGVRTLELDPGRVSPTAGRLPPFLRRDIVELGAGTELTGLVMAA